MDTQAEYRAKKEREFATRPETDDGTLGWIPPAGRALDSDQRCPLCGVLAFRAGSWSGQEGMEFTCGTIADRSGRVLLGGRCMGPVLQMALHRLAVLNLTA